MPLKAAPLAALGGLGASVLSAALWENPRSESEGWKESAWLGWIHHAEHGWLYPHGDDESSLWLWDQRLGWLWTGAAVYPFCYHAGGAGWLGYLPGTHEPRHFYHFETRDWAALYSLTAAPVRHSTERWEWPHVPFAETPEHQLLSYGGRTNTTPFDLTVVENDWIRIKLLPDWGGRILSIYDKPRDYELLYYPRAGARSEMIHVPGAFYYDWILLAYGINPTFPEGEHGKYWGVPWPLELIEEKADQITFRMSMVDDVDWPRHPAKFDNGRTDLAVTMDITVHRERAYVEVDYTLTNTRDETVAYEFWTPAAFAPTRLSADRIPPQTDIVMNHDRILVKDWWHWIAQTETNDETRGDDLYRFNQLRHLENWRGSGIAYAYPVLEIPWFGVLNQEERLGALRTTADDPDAAPGMKIWATGSDSLMFELWSGHPPEFFVDSFLGPSEERRWQEYYLPFAGLTDVSHATKFGAVQAVFASSGGQEQLHLRISGTIPRDVWRLRVSPVRANGVARPPALDVLVSLGPDGGLQERTLPLPTALISEDHAAWDFVITEAFSGEARMTFSVAP